MKMFGKVVCIFRCA